MLRVTADANILVSALLYRRGKSNQLLRKAIDGEINLTVSQPIIDETLEVLERKFGASRDFLTEARVVIGAAARIVQPAMRLNVVKEDQDDDKVLECAVSAGSDYIVTVADFLNIIQGREP